MEKRFYSPNELCGVNSVNMGCNERENDRIPACINTDYCLTAPENRNDGILAMAFVDMQPLESVYPQSEAFCYGSLFPNINKPFYGGKGR